MLLAIIDHDRGKIESGSLQTLTFLRQMASESGDSLGAAVVGSDQEISLAELKAYGLDQVYLIQHEKLNEYAPEAWASGINQLVDKVQPKALVAPCSERGNELMAYIGAKRSQAFSANTVKIDLSGEDAQVTRYRWGSSLWEEATLKGSPKMFTLAMHLVEAQKQDGKDAAVETFSPEISEEELRVVVSSRDEEQSDELTLKNAPIVIGGGRGVGSAEGFSILEDLAKPLGAVVGGSRVATNNGWRPHTDQIGLTGNRIAPQIYIACGISGAIQHLVGCKGAKNILVINNDPEAPFFAKADYGIIGDIHEVLPAITEEAKKQKSNA